MSSEFNVSDDVKELISEIIAKNNWEPVIEVKYSPGTELGDGYASKHVSVEIISENGTHRLFVKYALNIPNSADISIEKIYANETFFYDEVYPAYSAFLQKKRFENGFCNAPKCHGTSKKNVIALENLKDKGYTLFDRKKAMNGKHISFVLKTFAKFHAVSYAFKDQERKRYDQLAANTNQDFMEAESKGKDSPPLRMIRDMINDALNKLDPEADKHILEKCNADDLLSTITDVKHNVNEYSIITQGDCWCNNVMFLYESDNKENPVDVMLVDWQLVRPASPVFDISYFFYTIANEDALSKLNSYLKEYYTELSQQIRKLGSDPDQLYPFSVFEEEWKLYCKYGFAMAFVLFKLMLIAKDEIPKFEEIDFEEVKKMEKINVFTKFDNESEYIRRLRILGEFMVNNDYL